jgi:hypothetical protein
VTTTTTSQLRPPYLGDRTLEKNFRLLGARLMNSFVACCTGRSAGLSPLRNHPRNLAHTDSSAVTPISPAAQKFHVLIRCSLLVSSVTLSNSSMLGLMLGKRHIADANQNTAEPHAVISAAV